MKALRTLAVSVALLTTSSACTGDSADEVPNTAPVVSVAPTTAAAVTTTAPPAGETVPLERYAVTLTLVADLDNPIAMSVRPGDPALWVAERDGLVRRLEVDAATAEIVVDLRDEVGDITSEQGLLGLAWSPDGATLVVSYTDGSDDGASVIERVEFAPGSNRPQSRSEVLRVPQPHANHNGGNVVFGPDAMLWIGFGDGGGQGDPDNRAQDPTQLLGKLLRIDLAAATGDATYAVPSDNPFVGVAGQRPEIWALGLRNPWRFSFDRGTGDLWIADVGGAAFEEVNVLRAATGYRAPGVAFNNFGWRLREGFEPTSVGGDSEAADFVDPIDGYDHSVGSAITGGYVLRDPRLPELDGAYLFGDFTADSIWGLRYDGDEVVDRGTLDTGEVRPYSVASFGEGPNGEVYIVSLEGPIWRIDPA
ncbi:MAG: PQQ-dependent sugar dehydrogenase [Actinobacteria bacterium]|nr:PQQ-dependent sugar dehydrogenase [Actinomycetota bacterium]